LTQSKIKNIPASVRQRLLNIAKARGEDFQYVLTRYALERFLYRIGISNYWKRFVLKGAMLFQVWSPEVHRMTRDMDLLDSNNHEAKKVVQAIREILREKAPDDGLVFDGQSLRWSPIREGQAYQGVRLRFIAKLEKAVIPIQVDVGFGDLVIPKPARTKYPALLEFPAPKVLAYAKDLVIAEKLHAMVVHGMDNSRMKDYYDIWFLSQHFDFSNRRLSKAIRTTFTRRKTTLPSDWPVGLTDEFFMDPRVVTQWNAFWNKSSLPVKVVGLKSIGKNLRDFLKPFLSITPKEKGSSKIIWKTGGPWRPA